jgi:hypothetical protein
VKLLLDNFCGKYLIAGAKFDQIESTTEAGTPLVDIIPPYFMGFFSQGIP